MSKRQPGCLSFIFGSCYRKRSNIRNAVSVENLAANDRIKEIATQTQDQMFRSSAPASLFPSAHKPTIAVRDNKGFRVQSVISDRLVIKNADVNKFLPSVDSSENIESIQNDHNDDPLLSSKSLHLLFSPVSPTNQNKIIPNPFR